MWPISGFGILESGIMPINYLISTKIILAYAQWSGKVELPETREMFANYLNDENYILGSGPINPLEAEMAA